MANVSLFRRWRSQRFQDLVGQESVVRTLQNVLASGSPARAYLFCGPRGTGKTSSARIFAKALNCERGPGLEPCDECTQCREIAAGTSLDVFEIDAASHTQVDKIRDFIVDKVHFAPVSGRHKIYIIDEVHKLSTSSFNALLKTLEEPPSHVVFILATTHPHEMPPTILSRCQRYDFRPLTVGEIRRHLEQIGIAEGLSLEREATDQLARAADGSLRDALVLLEQAVTFCGESVSGEQVLELLGLVSYEVMEKMVRALHACDAAALLTLLHGLNAQGRDLKRLAAGFLEYLRLLMLVKVGSVDETFADMDAEERKSLEGVAGAVSLGELMAWIKGGMELANQVREGRQARLLWEMTLVQLVSTPAAGDASVLERRLDRLEQAVKALDSGSQVAPTYQAATPGEEVVSSQTDSVATVPSTPPPSEKAASASAKVSPPSDAPTSAKPPSDKPSSGKSPSDAPSIAKSPVEAAQVAKAPPAPQPSPAVETDPARAPGPPPSEAVSAATRVGRSREQVRLGVPEKGEPAVRQGGRANGGRAEPSGEGQGRARSRKEFWLRLMNLVREGDMRLHAVLADARLVEVTPEQVTLGLPDGYGWHRETILKSRSVLEDLSAQLLGRSVKLECKLEGSRSARGADEEHADMVRRASGLFAGEIVED